MHNSHDLYYLNAVRTSQNTCDQTVSGLAGLWWRYLCTLNAFLVAQLLKQMSQTDPTSICFDSICCAILCLILLTSPHSIQSQSPFKALCIFFSTRLSSTKSWLPVIPRNKWSLFFKSVNSRLVYCQSIFSRAEFWTTRALIAWWLCVFCFIMILHSLFVVSTCVTTQIAL